MTGRVVDEVLGGQRVTVVGTWCLVREEAEVVGPAKRGRTHEPHRLTGVDALRDGDLVLSLDDQVGDLAQHGLALFARRRRPGEEGLVRGAGGRVDVGRIAGGDVAEVPAVDR